MLSCARETYQPRLASLRAISASDGILDSRPISEQMNWCRSPTRLERVSLFGAQCSRCDCSSVDTPSHLIHVEWRMFAVSYRKESRIVDKTLDSGKRGLDSRARASAASRIPFSDRPFRRRRME